MQDGIELDLQEKVLDGRNRLEACRLVGVEPKFEYLNGEIESPTLYVVSRNLHRRHLTSSQRAAIAAEMLPLLQKEAQSRKDQRKRRSNGTFEPPPPTGGHGRARDSNVIAAKAARQLAKVASFGRLTLKSMTQICFAR